HRARGAVGDRALHRRPAAGAGDLPPADAGGADQAETDRDDGGDAEMSTIAQPTPAASMPQVERADIRSWKTPIALAIFSVIALILVVLVRREGSTGFRLSERDDIIQLPTISLPTLATGIVITVILFLMTALAFYWSSQRRKVPIWYVAIFAVLFMVGFLTWA